MSITVSEEHTQLKQRTIMAMKKMTSIFETYQIIFGVLWYVPSKSANKITCICGCTEINI